LARFGSKITLKKLHFDHWLNGKSEIQMVAAAQTAQTSNSQSTAAKQQATTRGNGRQSGAGKRQPNLTLSQQKQQDEKANSGSSQKSAGAKKQQQRNGAQQQKRNQQGVNQLTKGIKAMEVSNDPDDNLKPEPIYKSTANAKHTGSKIDFELFQNSSNELLFTIRKVEMDETFQRVVAPFSLCETFIEKLNLGLNELKANKEIGILNQLTSEQNAYFVNMLQLTSKRSRYFIDFKANDDKTDIILQISEKKRIPVAKGPSRTKNFILEFNVFDMNLITDKLQKFYNNALDAITSKPELDVHKVYGGNDFNLEWVKPKYEMNLLLKLSSHNGSRVMFPVNTVRQLSRHLTDIIEAFQKCGTDHNAYMDLINARRKDINERRETQGRSPLPEITGSLDEQFNRRPRKTPEGQEARANPFTFLYTQKMVSSANRRTYHFDLVMANESNDVRLRIVEQQHSQGQGQNPRQTRDSKKDGRLLRHTIYLPIDKVSEIIETLQLANDNAPLPQERSHYFPGGRCFFKMNVRSRGLTLKIKHQQALPQEGEPTVEGEQNEEGGSQQATHLTKYGNAVSIELPMGTVRTLMNYLKQYTNFAD